MLSGTPASGDQFLIQPTATAAGTFSAILTDPSKIAAAGAVQARPQTATPGATISGGTMIDPTNPNLLNPPTISFSTDTYTINGVANQTFRTSPAGAPIPPVGSTPQLGWQVQMSGTPAAGDSFTVKSNAGATGDNRNALLGAQQQTAGCSRTALSASPSR